jgi:hypothetical protein
VFNCPIRRAGIRLFPIENFVCLFMVALVCPFFCGAQSLADRARVLAGKTASSVHEASVSFEQHNISSLKDKDFSSAVGAFRDELQRRGVKILASGAGAKVTLTVSRDVTTYLGVAKIERGASEEVLFEWLGSVIDAAPGEVPSAVALHRELLFAQETPMLDVVMDADGKRADAMGLGEINTHELQDGYWVLTATESVPAQVAADREMRGFLNFGMDALAVYSPGEVCRFSARDQKGWSCESYRRQMPVRGVPEELLAGKKLGDWHSAARFEHDGRASVVVTAKDGLARLYGDGPEVVAVFRGWGSEIASIRSGCGMGWQVLKTSPGDWTVPDTVEAVEIQNGAARGVSLLVDFAGPVVALHAFATRGADSGSENKGVLAIVHNLQSGNYEAYRLTVSCGN